MVEKRNSLISFNSSGSSLFQNHYEKSLKGFNGLPQNILLKIFSHLDERDLRSVQQVCQKWRQGATDPSLWKNLVIRNLRSTQSLNDAMHKIWMYKELEKVYIKNVHEAASILRQIYRCLPNLKFLVLRYCKSLSSETIRALIRKCTKLEVLDLKGSSFDCNSFVGDLPRLENLRTLNLTDVHLTVRDLIDISLSCRKLEELYVSSIRSENEKLTDEDCKFIVSNLSPNLRGFGIDGATLTDLCFQRILLCNKLEHFGFHRAYNLNGKTLSVIWQYLKNLRTLKITFGNQIGNEDILHLFVMGKNAVKNLETIDFTSCWKMKNDSIQAISESCPNLKKLILKCCKNVTDISYLRACQRLEVLNIAFCPKLAIENWLPVPESLRTIFIDKGPNLNRITSGLRREAKVNIHVCPSQFKKSFETFFVTNEESN